MHCPMIHRLPSRRRLSVPIALAAALSAGGCASFSPDGGMTLVADQTASVAGKDVIKIRTPSEAAAAQARVDGLLAKPLTLEAAVQVALLNNRALQAAYNDLGVSEAQMIEASLPPSPTFSVARLAGSGFEIERMISQNVLALLTLPRRREIAEDKFAAAQLRAVEATLTTAAAARRAHVNAVAAQHLVTYYEEAQSSAEAVSELAKKLGETGALPKLDQAREHAFYAEVSGDLATARLHQRGEREKLNRVLGLWGETLTYRLPDRLKGLPGKPKTINDIETLAVTSRVDLELARMDLAALAKEHGLAQTTRYIDVLDLSGKSTRERTPTVETSYALAPGPTLVKSETPSVEKVDRNGLDLTFQIPIYDFGEARTRLAEESYMAAVNRLIDKAVNVRADARSAYQAYRGAYDIARHYDKDVLPLRDIISEQSLLNYNGMLSDLFALLTDARERIAANVKAIEARREFWLAAGDLNTAINGGGTAGETNSAPSILAASSSGEHE